MNGQTVTKDTNVTSQVDVDSASSLNTSSLFSIASDARPWVRKKAHRFNVKATLKSRVNTPYQKTPSGSDDPMTSSDATSGRKRRVRQPIDFDTVGNDVFLSQTNEADIKKLKVKKPAFSVSEIAHGSSTSSLSSSDPISDGESSSSSSEVEESPSGETAPSYQSILKLPRKRRRRYPSYKSTIHQVSSVTKYISCLIYQI